jgi:trans-aconitate methyltransferase
LISPPLVSIGRRVRFRHVAGAVRGLEPRSVLDAGCGDGRFTAWLRDRFPTAQVMGVDADSVMVERARARHPNLDLRVLAVGSEALEDRRFDLIVCTDVLEHIADDKAAFSWFARRLSPEGRLILHVPSDNQRHFPSISEALRSEIARGQGPHLREGYTAGELGNLASEVGLRVLSVDATFVRYLVRLAVDTETWISMHGLRPLKLVLVPALLAAAALERHPDPQGHGHGRLLVAASAPRSSGAE